MHRENMMNRIHKDKLSSNSHDGAFQAFGEGLKRYFDAHKSNKSAPSDLYARTIQEVETHLLQQTMEFTSGNQVRAARILGISRNTLRKRLARLSTKEQR
jgi:two-component system nitrogen regulation response regulator GlnG